MKSFNKFLQEAYISEEETRQGSLFTRSGKPQDFRNPNKTPFTATDPTPTPASRRLPAAEPSGAPRTSPGQMEIPAPGGRTTRVQSSQLSGGEARQGSLLTRSGKAQNFTNPNKTPFTATDPTPTPASRRLPAAQSSGSPRTSPGQMEIDFNARPNRGGALATRPTSTPSAPVGTPSNPQRIYPTPMSRSASPVSGGQKALLSARKTSDARNILGTASNVNTAADAGSKLLKSSGKLGGVKNFIGKAAGPASAAIDVGLETMAQKERGRKTGSALAMGATKAGSGLAGAQAGAALGAAVGSVVPVVGTGVGAAVGGIGGYLAGSELGGRAAETVAGATGKEKTAMATANRQRQAGTSIKGIGGKTTFSQTKPGGPAFMSTGVGSQRKTVQLAKTGVVQRGGQSVAGHLAFKGGKAVYKAGPSAQSLARTSSNPLERIGRSLFAGAYKKHDIAKSQQALQAARQSDVARNKKLGVKAKPGG